MWAAQGKVDRLPASYTRPNGVRHWLAFYDVRTDQLWGYVRRRKRWSETLYALQRLRAMYPVKERVYVILDNFSPHRRLEVRRWARTSNVVFVWTPTNASWLNKIECQFTELKRFVFHNSNYTSHSEVRLAMLKFLRYRNTRNRKRKLKLTNLKRH
jgi:transposase